MSLNTQLQELAESRNSGSKQSRKAVETLAENPNMVAVVNREIAGRTITRYYVRVNCRFAEIQSDAPTTEMREKTLIDRLDKAGLDNVTLQFQDELAHQDQRMLVERVAPIHEQDTDRSTGPSPARQAKHRGRQPKRKNKKHIPDDPDELDVATAFGGAPTPK